MNENELKEKRFDELASITSLLLENNAILMTLLNLYVKTNNINLDEANKMLQDKRRESSDFLIEL
ncbi:hypothetical protein [uncultured Draconibacterium sp.]|uniref:hypothetical protein n=1 Tax=uncultured Draconibacterium sp. TaxID=1573823 RepID=UPI003261790F